MPRPLLSRFILAHVIALPLEAINFFFCGFPVDVGYAPGTPWYVQTLGAQWLLVHYIGLKIAGLFSWSAHPDWSRVVIFLGGFVETSVLFVLIAWTVYALRRQRPPIRTLEGH